MDKIYTKIIVLCMYIYIYAHDISLNMRESQNAIEMVGQQRKPMDLKVPLCHFGSTYTIHSP